MALTNKQQAFIEEYLLDFNATRAAERAGYKGNTNSLACMGHDLLRNPKIEFVVRQRLQDKAMRADEVLMRLAEQARATICGKLADMPKRKDFTLTDEQVRALTQAIKQDKRPQVVHASRAR